MAKKIELTYEEAKKMLKISPNNLSEELANHAVNLQEVAERAMLIKAERDTVKMEIETLEASIGREIRSDPNPAVKLTVDAINSMVMTDSRRLEKLNEYMSLCEEADLWHSLYTSFTSRGYMLRDLVEMTKNIFMSPDSDKPPYIGDNYEANKASMARVRRTVAASV